MQFVFIRIEKEFELNLAFFIHLEKKLILITDYQEQAIHSLQQKLIDAQALEIWLTRNLQFIPRSSLFSLFDFIEPLWR